MKNDKSNVKIDKEWIAYLLTVVVMVATIAVVVVWSSSSSNSVNTNTSKEEESGFVILEEWYDCSLRCNIRTVYAKDTKIKYMIASRTYGLDITPLYNPDGTLQLYEEGEK